MNRTIFLDVKKNSRLDDFLRENLPSALDEFFGSEKNKILSNSKIRRLIFSRNVFCENRAVKNPAFILKNSSRVKILLDGEKLFFEKQNGDIEFSLFEKDIIFEDDFLLAVNKPCGIPSERTFLESRASLFDAVQKYLREKNPGAENYCSAVHRLDKGTSGVILFSKQKSVNAALHEMFGGGNAAERAVKKIYLAVCTKSTAGSASAFLRGAKNPESEISFEKDEFSVSNFLGRVSEKSEEAKFGEVAESCGGKFARTDFRILERRAEKFLVQARLFTGRTHQIRAHLSQCRMPILGDRLYGGERAQRIFLHALKLELPHPCTGENLELISPVPKEFEECFYQLR